MKKQTLWSIVGIAIVSITSWTVVAQTQKETTTKTSWEYTYVAGTSYPDLSNLNRLGNEGWELVGVDSACANGSCTTTAYLKRRK